MAYICNGKLADDNNHDNVARRIVNNNRNRGQNSIVWFTVWNVLFSIHTTLTEICVQYFSLVGINKFPINKLQCQLN